MRLCPRTGGRNELVDNRIYYDDSVPIGEQEYHIARFAITWALVAMGLIADASPHAVAIALCGVRPPPPRREAEPMTRRPAEVVRLRPRR